MLQCWQALILVPHNPACCGPRALQSWGHPADGTAQGGVRITLCQLVVRSALARKFCAGHSDCVPDVRALLVSTLPFISQQKPAWAEHPFQTINLAQR